MSNLITEALRYGTRCRENTQYRAIGFIFTTGTLEWLGYNVVTGEGRMMIDSVVWAQYINVTDTQTATSP